MPRAKVVRKGRTKGMMLMTVKQLTETRDEHLVERIPTLALEESDMLEIDRIRTRGVGYSAT